MNRKKSQSRTVIRWDYPPLGEALGGVGLELVEVYITRRPNMAKKYIATSPIMEIYVWGQSG